MQLYSKYKTLSSLFLAVLFLCIACQKELPEVDPSDSVVDSLPDDTLAFSVSQKKRVYFAPGNLDVHGRVFVENEWNYGGYFGWGTGDRPTSTSLDNADYQDFLDWGDYVFYEETGWRTLSMVEWRYLLVFRDRAEFRRGTAKVNGIHGMVLLPDGWTAPEGITFSPGCIHWEDNVYSKVQWEKMKEAGAVFLPASDFIYEGIIVDGHVYDPGPHQGDAGYYWTSTPSGNEAAFCVCFYDGRVYTDAVQQRCYRMSVRLVRDAKD